jgi:hypothetical protein
MYRGPRQQQPGATAWLEHQGRHPRRSPASGNDQMEGRHLPVPYQHLHCIPQVKLAKLRRRRMSPTPSVTNSDWCMTSPPPPPPPPCLHPVPYLSPEVIKPLLPLGGCVWPTPSRPRPLASCLFGRGPVSSYPLPPTPSQHTRFSPFNRPPGVLCAFLFLEHGPKTSHHGHRWIKGHHHLS